MKTSPLISRAMMLTVVPTFVMLFLLIFCPTLAILARFAWTSLRTMMISGDLHVDMLSMPHASTPG
jgi:hypothetical protein